MFVDFTIVPIDSRLAMLPRVKSRLMLDDMMLWATLLRGKRAIFLVLFRRWGSSRTIKN